MAKFAFSGGVGGTSGNFAAKFLCFGVLNGEEYSLNTLTKQGLIRSGTIDPVTGIPILTTTISYLKIFSWYRAHGDFPKKHSYYVKLNETSNKAPLLSIRSFDEGSVWLFASRGAEIMRGSQVTELLIPGSDPYRWFVIDKGNPMPRTLWEQCVSIERVLPDMKVRKIRIGE